MAAFTEVPFETAAVKRTENIKHFAYTTQGRFVLTLFERLSHAQLPFDLHRMKRLARHVVLAPDLQADVSGGIPYTLRGLV